MAKAQKTACEITDAYHIQYIWKNVKKNRNEEKKSHKRTHFYIDTKRKFKGFQHCQYNTNEIYMFKIHFVSKWKICLFTYQLANPKSEIFQWYLTSKDHKWSGYAAWNEAAMRISAKTTKKKTCAQNECKNLHLASVNYGRQQLVSSNGPMNSTIEFFARFLC